MSLRVAFVAEGDAETHDCWSGSGRSFVGALRAQGVRVDLYDAELRSWPRAVAAALSYHPMRARWRQRYGLGTVAFHARSALVNRKLAASNIRYDAVIQVGATFATSKAARRGAAYVLYCDSNLAYALRGAPYSAASRLGRREIDAVVSRERRVYDAADRIWAMSDAVADSFRKDFKQPADKVSTIYAGPNYPPSPGRVECGIPRILFVGKDHERKGSATLLDAFDLVRRVVPEAELHIVGGVPPNSARPGVITHGFLSRAIPEGKRQLDALFGSARVFCMPSRYEPFGIAFVEAMLAELPCVGTRGWAMPEIIEDGKSGWLVPDNSVEELARVLVTALTNPSMCARMGAAGRERSLRYFTWSRVVMLAMADLELLRETASAGATALV